MEFVETDIQDFLDDLFNQEEAKDYTNLTDAQINYYIRRIKTNKARMDEVSERRKVIQSDYETKLKLWEAKNKETLQNDIDHCLNILQEYYESHEQDRSKKLVFPEGRMGFYNTRQTLSVDKDVAFKDIKQLIDQGNTELQKYIVLTESLDAAKLKSAGEVDENNNFKINGQIIPGVKVTPATTKFSIR